MRQVLVPDIGEFAGVPVVEIFVSPGQAVALEDPLVTLESDKATMDIPSPFAGVVGELLVALGEKVSEGSPLLTVELDSDGASGETPAPAAAEQSPAAVGSLAGVTVAPPSKTTSGDGSQPSAGEQAERDGGRSSSPVYASPSVRRLARERGVDVGVVVGSGRHARVLPGDVERVAAGAPASGMATVPWPAVDYAKFGPIESEPLTRIKRIAGPNLHRNWVTIPHVTQHDEADITTLEAFRLQANERLARDGVKLTVLALLLKASVAALQAFPEFNSSLDGENLVLKRYYNIGFAADTPQGLVVPVIREVDRKGLAAIALELAELSANAREGKLAGEQMRGGTFTISSLGGIGGTAFTPIVNAPEVAILGVSRSACKPVWTGSEFEPRLMLPLSLSYDHRVIDGAAAARFVVHLAGLLADMRLTLL